MSNENVRLKIELRHKQLFADFDPNQPVVVDCSQGFPVYVPGFVPMPDWVDVTFETENLQELKITWQAQTQDYSSDGSSSGQSDEVNNFGSNYSKGVTLDMRFIGNAFQMIYDWLMTTPCQTLNALEVRITDLDCQKTYRLFEIKLDNTKYSPLLEQCIVSMSLRENDATWHSFQTTAIEDDWQKWFNADGTSVKQHPTFLFVVDKKPKFFLTILVVLAYIVGMLSIGIVIGSSDGRIWIRKLLGLVYFCPSPLIRTHIENICQKYGYDHNTIFDDDPANPYRDACLFYPVEQSIGEFENLVCSQTTFINNNRTLLPFTKYLDQLKKVFNAEWYVTPNKTLVFQPRSYFDNLPPIYDFSNPNNIQLVNLTYTFNGDKKPAYGNYSYQLDPQDACTNESKWRYNTIVNYQGNVQNAVLEGNITKQFDFAATSFHRDGTSEDAFRSSVELGRIIAAVCVLIGMGSIFLACNFLTDVAVAALLALGYNITNNFIHPFTEDATLDGAVRCSGDTINIPRILIWDRNTPMNQAKVVKFRNPTQVPYYNTTNLDYYQDHPGFEDVEFGNSILDIYNYPMFVDEKFEGNLFDRFHEHDNPLKVPDINQTWEGQIPICCEMLDLLGVWDGDYAKIGGVVIVENRNGRLIKGRIETIEPDYKNGYINLNGRVLK